MWQKANSVVGMDWEKALAYAEGAERYYNFVRLVRNIEEY